MLYAQDHKQIGEGKMKKKLIQVHSFHWIENISNITKFWICKTHHKSVSKSLFVIIYLFTHYVKKNALIGTQLKNA